MRFKTPTFLIELLFTLFGGITTFVIWTTIYQEFTQWFGAEGWVVPAVFTIVLWLVLFLILLGLKRLAIRGAEAPPQMMG